MELVHHHHWVSTIILGKFDPPHHLGWLLSDPKVQTRQAEAGEKLCCEGHTKEALL